VPVQRFLPDVDRTRRAAGWILIALFAFPLVWILRIVAAGHPNGTAIAIFLVVAGMLALGLRLAFRPLEFLEIDLEDRKFNVIRKGKRIAAGALDSLGPLEVRMRKRVVESDHERRTITEYVVQAAVHSKIDLYVMKTSGQARKRMEALARAWRLPCQSYGGALRSADALDTPLHERLRGDSAAGKVQPLSADWGVRIEPAPMGYAMVSTFRSWAPLQLSAIVLVLALFPLGGSTYYGLTTSIWNGDPLAQVLGALMGIVVLAVLGFAYVGVRDTFFPGTVRITERGVSYRGRRMRFNQIEEVTATSPIEIVGDRRILRLAETFCPAAATTAVAHELQRLIIEVASSTPDQA
jgi:hypothetical protein